MSRLHISLLCMFSLIALHVVSAASEIGCSHGYWKNHVSEWPSPWKSSTKISEMFHTTDWTKVTYDSSTSKDTTLLDALKLGGGQLSNVYRQAIAAYFNAVKYGSATTGYTVDDIKLLFKQQAESKNPNGDGLELKAVFCDAKQTTTTKPPTNPPTTIAPTTQAPTNPPTTKAPSAPGCSHGYWKNHVEAWPAPWTTNTKISDVFDTTDWTKVNYNSAKPDSVSKDTTLLDALNLGGGGLANVYRQGVAAYFNAEKYGSATTGYTVDEIKLLFKQQAESNNPNGDGLEQKAVFCHGKNTPTPTPTISAPTRGDADIRGDPQFSGFQGQSFQFHGLADEHFNLISSPHLQINSHFVFLSSGRCHYNNTLCFQHPGTYVDALGFIIPSVGGEVYIKLVSGSHDEGLRVWMSSDTPDEPTEISLNEYPDGLTWQVNNDSTQHATVMYTEAGEITIKTPLLHVRVVNAEYFFNLEMGLLDRHVLRLGRPHHIINDRSLCHHNSHGEATIDNDRIDEKSIHENHDHGKVEQVLIEKYQVDFPLHGLIGQTWRNAVVCGKPWIGHVNDYVTSDLFSSDYYYNMRD